MLKIRNFNEKIWGIFLLFGLDFQVISSVPDDIYDMNEITTRQLTMSLMIKMTQDIGAEPVDINSLKTLNDFSIGLLLKSLKENSFMQYIHQKCFIKGISYRNAQELLGEDISCLTPYLNLNSIKLDDIYKNLKFDLLAYSVMLDEILKDNYETIHQSAFLNYLFGNLLAVSKHKTFHKTEKYFLNRCLDLLNPSDSLYILSAERLIELLDNSTVHRLRPFCTGQTKLPLYYQSPRHLHKKVHVLAGNLDPTPFLDVIAKAPIFRLPDYAVMRILQILLNTKRYFKSQEHFLYACERIEEIANHKDVKKIHPEYIWELTQNLLSDEFKDSVPPGVLNSIYRYAHHQFDENHPQEELPINFPLPSQDPFKYHKEIPIKNLMTSPNPLFHYRPSVYMQAFKKKIINLLNSACFDGISSRALDFDKNILSQLMLELEIRLINQTGRLNRTLTFIATDDTIGDKKNPETMDYFMGNQYPWLSFSIPALRSKFKHIEVESWQDDTVEWNAKQLLIMGPVWGYTKDTQKFTRWVEGLAKLNIPTLNDPNFILWNLNKLYLTELPQDIIIQSTFVKPEEDCNLNELFFEYGTDQLIIKGIIDAGAFNLKLISKKDIEEGNQHVKDLQLKNGGAIIQPFMDMSQGEISVVFNGSIASHCFIKVPAHEDFRTQPFYGAKTFHFPIDDIIDDTNRSHSHSTPTRFGLFFTSGEKVKRLYDYAPDKIFDDIKEHNPNFYLSEKDIKSSYDFSYVVREKIFDILIKKKIIPPQFLRVDLLPYQGKFLVMEIEGIEPYTMARESSIADQKATFSAYKVIEPLKQSNYTTMIWNWALKETTKDILNEIECTENIDKKDYLVKEKEAILKENKIIKDDLLNQKDIKSLRSISYSNALSDSQGIYNTYDIYPTLSDGDCCFHAIFTQEGEDQKKVKAKAQKMRAQLCDDWKKHEKEWRNLTFEDYLQKYSQNLDDLPANIRILFQKNQEHQAARNYLKSILKEGSSLPEEISLEFRYSDDYIKQEISEGDVRAYVENFRENKGEQSYIPVRADMVCPAEIIAFQNSVRINIFISNDKTRNLDLYKTVGDEKHSVRNILIINNHYEALCNQKESEQRQKGVQQIAKNTH